jgi:hypothetical protein
MQNEKRKEKSWAGDSFAADSEAADCKLSLLLIKSLLQTTERSSSIGFQVFLNARVVCERAVRCVHSLTLCLTPVLKFSCVPIIDLKYQLLSRY